MALIDRIKYAGHDMSDVASLVADGLTYECTVFLNRTEWSIDTVCKRIQDDGTRVLVFANSVDVATATEIDDTNGTPLDNPKILAVGTTFVVHWLSADDIVTAGEDSYRNWVLNRASMDMEAFSAFFWTDENNVSIYPDGLYDAQPIQGTDRILLAYHDPSGPIRYRVQSLAATIDLAGVSISNETLDDTFDSSVHVYPRVLGCYGHAGDNTLAFVFEHPLNAGFLTLVTVDYTNNDQSSWLNAVFNTTGDIEELDYLQVGIERVAENTVVVAAEAITTVRFGQVDPRSWDHLVIYGLVTVNENDAPVRGFWTYAWHYHLCSRPFVWQRTATESSAYVLVSYRSIVDPYEWEQSYQYVVNLDLDRLSAIPGLLRPRIISTMASIGIPDGRTSGFIPDGQFVAGFVHQGGPAKRTNHVSSVAQGPQTGVEVKTKVVSTLIWSAADYPEIVVGGTTFTTKKPTNASVYNLVVFLEEPWAEYREPSLPEQPTVNLMAANPRALCQAVEVGRSTIFGGGTLHSYDGSHITELGFPWNPEIFTVTQSEVASGSVAELTPGPRLIYAIFSFRDDTGQWHRSGPSNIQAFTITSTNNVMTYDIRTMTGSLKDSLAHYPDADRISIEIFRTIAGGAEFFKLFASDSSYVGAADYREKDTPLNVASEPYISVYDGMSDADLLANNVTGPYQFGETVGIFDPEAPIVAPAMSVIAAWSNRLWGADALDQAVIWYSDEILPDFGGAGQFYVVPQFLPSAFFRIGEVGEITSMIGMHNALILFTATGIRALIVQDAGAGLLGVQVQVLHSEVGCIEPRSVVLAPDGVYFQSFKGYHLLSRDHQVQYVGAAVEDIIRGAGNIRAASHMRDRHQIRLTLNDAPETTQTQVFEVDSYAAGTWSITGFDVPVQYVTSPGDDAADVAVGLVARLNELTSTPLVGNPLREQLGSVFVSGSEVHVRLAPDVALTLLLVPSGGGLAITNTAAFEVEVFPSVLVYDTLFQRWSQAVLPYATIYDENAEFRNEAVDGIAWGGNGAAESHVVLEQGAVMVQRQPTDALAHADQNHTGDIAVPIDLLTSWFHASGVAGLQRIWELVIQASKPQASEILVDLDYILDGDYDNPVSETGLTVTDISPAKMRVRPSIQRCTAIRVRIYEAPSGSGSPPTENVRIASITYKVGVRKGPGRVADTQIAT